ncbi:hypothetical protein [Psychromonas sp. Urea-02u-13]|nr:hypothetical protein [Psychromonas sp. Urea-02u-13]
MTISEVINILELNHDTQDVASLFNRDCKIDGYTREDVEQYDSFLEDFS